MSSVVVAVLTFRRNGPLLNLLEVLVEQVATCTTPAQILVVDNDPGEGARSLVERYQDHRVRYVAESTPGIAAGRNRALVEAGSDLLVFIDDDERPSPGWLNTLLATKQACSADAVIGPVIHEYETPLDAWISVGQFFERPRYPTGTRRQIGATNNLLLDLTLVRQLGLSFDVRFGLSGGSDTLFTKQFSDSGAIIVWCDEAPVYDPVPATRTTRKWAKMRVFRLGNTWSRVRVQTAESGPATARTRVTLVIAGLGRILVGAALVLAGLFGRSLRQRANGVRLIMRGAGLAGGALGYVYVEYRRADSGAVRR